MGLLPDSSRRRGRGGAGAARTDGAPRPRGRRCAVGRESMGSRGGRRWGPGARRRRRDRQPGADRGPPLKLLPGAPVHSYLATLAALATAHEHGAACRVEIALLKSERFADPQPCTPQHDDHAAQPETVGAIAGCAPLCYVWRVAQQHPGALLAWGFIAVAAPLCSSRSGSSPPYVETWGQGADGERRTRRELAAPRVDPGPRHPHGRGNYDDLLADSPEEVHPPGGSQIGSRSRPPRSDNSRTDCDCDAASAQRRPPEGRRLD